MVPILLTGATGYLGSRVAMALDMLGLRYHVLRYRLESIKPGSLSGYQFVIHCAGALRSRPEQLQVANVDGMSALLSALPDSTRILFVSSRSVYPASGHVVVDERQKVLPWDCYGESKLQAEILLRESGKPFVIFRAAALFGHPCRSVTFPDFATDMALAGESIGLAVPDPQVDYLDVEALAQFLLRACSEGDHWGRVFNVAGPVRSLGGMLKTLQNVLIKQSAQTVSIHPLNIPAPQYPLLDSRQLRAFFPDVRQAADTEIFSRMLAGRCQIT